jgi:hypothetical protein
MFIELARSLFHLQIKQTNKQIACMLHVKDFAYMEICIAHKYTSLEQHPTPNPKKRKKKTKKQTPHLKIFNSIIKRLLFSNFLISKNLAKFSKN